MQHEKKLYSVPDAAFQLGISSRMMYRFIASHEIPITELATNQKHKWRVSSTALDAFIEARTVSAK
jgi:excisionase family DNA binding protein